MSYTDGQRAGYRRKAVWSRILNSGSGYRDALFHVSLPFYDFSLTLAISRNYTECMTRRALIRCGSIISPNRQAVR
jgi:hypothetical protein